MTGINRIASPLGPAALLNRDGRSIDYQGLLQDPIWDTPGEKNVPLASVITDGPTMQGDAILNVSIFANGCFKSTNITTFYRDSTVLYSVNQSIGFVDSQAGNIATASLTIPAWPRAAAYMWTWTSNCGNAQGWGWWTTRRRIWVPPRLNAVQGLG